jgi:predicted dienelactone hydrolase
MRKIVFLTFIVLSTSLAQPENPGQMKSGWTSTTLNREGRTFNTIIYYPSFVEGSNTQIDTLNGPYPIIAFGHGFAMQNSYYISLFKHLASYGYIVIAPQFPDVNHLQLGFDLIFCVNHIKALNKNPSSIFFKIS